jgi:hypothetical protein
LTNYQRRFYEEHKVSFWLKAFPPTIQQPMAA